VCQPVAHFLCSTARIRRDISAASLYSCKLLGRSDECVLLPCFNALPDVFAVMSCCVVAVRLFSSDSLAWSADYVVYIQCNDTWNKGSGCRKICILCQQTSPNHSFGNMTMTSNCDVRNGAHQIQMTTICHIMKTLPHENFLRTPLVKSFSALNVLDIFERPLCHYALNKYDIFNHSYYHIIF